MYSNCLFEAIKAKLKDPKNVKIHKVPAFLNPNFKTPFPHFYWTKGDKAFEFNTVKPRSLQVFIFKGKIQEYTISEMNENLKRCWGIAAHKLCKKYGDIFEEYKMHDMFLDSEKPVLEKYKPEWVIISFLKNNNEICTRLISINDFDKYENVLSWRYADGEVVAAHFYNETATEFFNEDGYKLH